METTFLSVLTAICGALAIGMVKGMIATQVLMRVFARNHTTAKAVSKVLVVLFVGGFLGAILLALALLGQDFGTLWLITTITLVVLGSRIYRHFLSPYSAQQVKQTGAFLGSLLKPKAKD